METKNKKFITYNEFECWILNKKKEVLVIKFITGDNKDRKAGTINKKFTGMYEKQDILKTIKNNLGLNIKEEQLKPVEMHKRGVEGLSDVSNVAIFCIIVDTNMEDIHIDKTQIEYVRFSNLEDLTKINAESNGGINYTIIDFIPEYKRMLGIIEEKNENKFVKRRKRPSKNRPIEHKIENSSTFNDYIEADDETSNNIDYYDEENINDEENEIDNQYDEENHENLWDMTPEELYEEFQQQNYDMTGDFENYNW